MMNEETNPVKDYLFEYIDNSKTIPQLISEEKYDSIINDVVKRCYDKALAMENEDTAVGNMATGLLHYLLTNSPIPSQRKIEYRGQKIDIVIPDIKTLEKDAKRSLIICIPGSSSAYEVGKKLSGLEKIQPEKDNIWVVLSKNLKIERRSFVLDKQNNTFSEIIFEISQFSNASNSASRLRILRS